MLPNIDTINPGASGVVPPKRPEVDKAMEAYRTASSSDQPEEIAAKRALAAREQTGPSKSKTEIMPAQQDRADLKFRLSAEERDAFQAAFDAKQDPATMSPEERETLKKASERISKFIEEAAAKSADNRERVEKAVSEWYSRLSKGEREGPIDLINLLRQAAMGKLDDLAT